MRVRMGHLPVRYACLSRWVSLRRECWEQNASWPWPESRKAVADEFRAVCQGVPGKDWTQVRVLSERGLRVDDFLKAFAAGPARYQWPAAAQTPAPPAPAVRPPRAEGASACVDLQDNLAALYKPGLYAEIRPDLAASDLRTVWMPGTYTEWAFRISGKALPRKAQNGNGRFMPWCG